MAFVLADRVKEPTTTTGTGSLTLGGAESGFESFSVAVGNGNTTYYAIVHRTAAEWEVGIGTVSAGALARTTVIASSNGNAAVNFSAGTKDVFVGLPASKAISSDVIHAAAEKATIGDADEFPMLDSAASFSLKRLTWGRLKAEAYLGMYRNKIINGRMEHDQVNNGSAVTPASAMYVLDNVSLAGNLGSKLTFQRVTDAPAGFKNSLKVTVASQHAPAASDGSVLVMYVEGGYMADFAFGTTGALVITASMQIKGSVAGTYAVAIRNGASNRSYVGTMTVTTAWAPVTITLSGDTTGTWANDNTLGLMLSIDLGSGSTYQTTAGSWQVGNFVRTSGSVTFVNQAVGSTLFVTGVQLEKGSIATESEFRMGELTLCQRYFRIFGDGLIGAAVGADRYDINLPLTVPMRTTPTVSLIPNASIGLEEIGYVGKSGSTIDSIRANALGIVMRLGGFSGATLGRPAMTVNNTNGIGYLDARL